MHLKLKAKTWKTMPNNQDSIVLLAKKSGPTSFSSLRDIKKALNTTKVGHTGTLDSFAQGLLVVCTGRLTKLAGNITEFNKVYDAVIKFGEETDTLEPTGNIIKTTDLPDLSVLQAILPQFKGNILQRPPQYSAIHINGQRASDLMRQGFDAKIPEREVTVFDLNLKEYKLNAQNKVLYALIEFSVSKGTYIRSLARDIGENCSSSAHLIGLYRKSVGNFKVEDAAGFSTLPKFTIQNAISQINDAKNAEKFKNNVPDLDLHREIVEKMQPFTEETSLLCGFKNIHLLSAQNYEDFKNGKNIHNKAFAEDLFSLEKSAIYAVFFENIFCGLLEKNAEGRISYKFVIN